MDINLGRLAAYVRLDFSKLKSDQDRARKSLKDFNEKLTKEVGESFTSLGQKMSIGLTAPLIALGKSAVDSAVKMESWQRGLNAVTGSAEETGKQLARLRELSKMPGLTFEGAVKGSIRLHNAGLSAKEAEKSLRAFGNAVARVGGGKEELDGVNRALTQMLNKGKITAEEINGQLGEWLPGLQRAMKAAFGTADAEVLQKAGVTAKQFVQAMTAEYGKMAQVQRGSKESFEEFNEVMQDGLRELGKAILPDVTKAMKELGAGIQNGIKWWKSLDDGTKQNIIRFAEFAAVTGPLILAIGAVASAVNSVTLAFGTMRTVVASSVAAIGKVVPILGGIARSVAGIGMLSAGLLVGSAGAANAPGRPRGKPKQELELEKAYLEQLRGSLMNDMPKGERDSALSAFNRTKQRIRDLYAEIGKKDAAARIERGVKESQRAQDALQKQMRAQVAGVGSADAAKKAAAARNKAAAEAARRKAAAERARRVQVGHDTAEYNLFAGNEAADKAAMDAQIADWTQRAMEAEEKRKKNVWMDFFAKLRGMGDRLRAEAGERQQELNAKSATGAAVGKAFDALSQAVGRMGPLMQKAEETRTKQTEAATKERLALEDRYQQHLARMGRTSLSQYQSYLEQRLAAVRGNVEEEIRIESELQQVKFGMMEEQERKRYRGWQNLARGLENVFATAFYDVLASGKNFFQSFLDAFKQMIAQMLAAALAAGLMRALFGGGNFVTGFLSVFGFDNGANDSRAHRWGRDFSHHFADGAAEYSRTRAMQGQAGMAAAGAGGPVNVTINFGPVSVASGMDVQAIGEQIGQATRNALRRRV